MLHVSLQAAWLNVRTTSIYMAANAAEVDSGIAGVAGNVAGTCVSIFVIGASGDLARKKTYPSLFELHVNGLLPSQTTIVGYARSSISDADFRHQLAPYLAAGTDSQRTDFLSRCIYRNGGYDDAAAFQKVRWNSLCIRHSHFCVDQQIRRRNTSDSCFAPARAGR